MVAEQNIKVFIASSDELKKERKEIPNILNEIQAFHKKESLQSVKWETNISSGSYPNRPQDEINKELSDSEILIILFYSKIGAYTKEEFELALKNNKKIFLYFKKGFKPENENKLKLYQGVVEFKEEIQNKTNILYREYKTIQDLRNIIYQDINNYLNDKHNLENVINESKNEYKKILKNRIREGIWKNIRLSGFKLGGSKSNGEIESDLHADPGKSAGKNIDDIFKNFQNVILLGGSGAGKSTILEILEDKYDGEFNVWIVPLKLYSHNFSDTIIKYYGFENLDSSVFAQQLRQNNSVFLIDGLNELLADYREDFFREIERFVLNADMNIKIWLTCRTQNIDEYLTKDILKKFSKFFILPLNTNDRLQILEERLTINSNDNKQLEEMEGIFRKTYGDAVNSIQFFTSVSDQFKENASLPKTRFEVIKNIIGINYDRYYQRKKMVNNPAQKIYDILRIVELLSEIAWLTNNQTSQIALNKNTLTIFEKHINDIYKKQIGFEQLLSELANWAPIEIYSQGEYFYFQHDIFREAFCGQKLLEKDNEEISDKLRKKEWRESFVFAAEESDLEMARFLINLLREQETHDFDLCARIALACSLRHKEKINENLIELFNWLVNISFSNIDEEEQVEYLITMLKKIEKKDEQVFSMIAELEKLQLKK